MKSSAVSAPSFSNEQVDVLNHTLGQVRARIGLTGSTPVIELVAVRILELARAGEFDPERLTDMVSMEFDLRCDSEDRA
jgi:hypothetical protein